MSPKLLMARPMSPKLLMARPMSPKLLMARPMSPKLLMARPMSPKLLMARPMSPKLLMARPMSPTHIFYQNRLTSWIADFTDPPISPMDADRAGYCISLQNVFCRMIAFGNLFTISGRYKKYSAGFVCPPMSRLKLTVPYTATTPSTRK